MSIFDQNTPKENSEELLYIELKEELDEVFEKYYSDNRVTVKNNVFYDDVSLEDIKKIETITLQFVWRKLGMKLPNLTRNELDKDYKIMELKNK